VIANDGNETRYLTVAAPAGAFVGTLHDDGSAVFAGIPFAQPPVGELRFRPPQPLRDAQDAIDATRFRAAPAQVASALAVSTRSADEGEPAASGLGVVAAGTNAFETSEDCLYLNVWTPDPSGSLPVIVWIYGGGFDIGSAAPPITHGAALSRLTGAVVVSINYRVGALGFGHWRGVAGEAWAESSNLGLRDQIAGLAWVRRNIAAFGGDAARVTVAGQSAGGFSIGSLLAIPAARTMFDKAIMHSGSTRRIFAADTADSIARDLMARLSVDTIEQLQRVDVARILAAQSQVIDTDIGRRNLAGGRSWGVVLDGELLTEYPLEAVARGAARGIPLMVGANRDETLPFASGLGPAWVPADEAALLAEIARTDAANPQAVLDAYRAQSPALATAALGELRSAFLTDAIYRRPAIETAAAQRSADGHAWSYLFSAAPFGPAVGAGHGTDLAYAFDTLADTGQSTEQNRAIQSAFMGAWGEFARTGHPGWREYDYATPDSTRQFGGASDFLSEPAFGPIRDAWPVVTQRNLP
jgi:para-nitrobenzyl esterase